MAFSDELSWQLFTILIDDASEENVAALGNLIEEYKRTYWSSYAGLKKRFFPMVILNAIEEAVELRAQWDFPTAERQYTAAQLAQLS